ncbi:MAG: ABC transporter permease subunit [Deltaproteobacteria bacterium]|nr:ABC transporter permease subunit [Deltaproteobacteria bacterium]
MNRVARALALHEFVERTRDRWVVIVSILFAALASAVSAYGRSAGEGSAGATLTGPSLVTLASLFVPLVALVLSHDAIVGERERNTLGLLLSLPITRMEAVFAKLVGRGAALVLSVSVGLGAAMAFTSAGERATLAALLGPTLLLGLAFLAIGLFISTIASRQAVAASMVVVAWFGMVFFYDLGLLGVLVVSDGTVSQELIANLVLGNPAGLYRVTMMEAFVGPEALTDLGLVAELPSRAMRGAIWAGWIIGPALVSGLILLRKKVVR